MNNSTDIQAADLEVGKQPLSGSIFVITGKMQDFSRDDMKNAIQANGGKVTGSVSSKTDYLVVGENPGSKKDKAVDLGIKIIKNGSEPAF